MGGKTALNAVAEKLLKPELAGQTARMDSWDRKLQLDGTLLLELLYQTAARREVKPGETPKELRSFDLEKLTSWMRHVGQ